MTHGWLIAILAGATGVALMRRFPFPEGDNLLVLLAYYRPTLFEGLRWSWTLMLFTTPALLYSGLSSLLYIFRATGSRRVKGTLAPFPKASDDEPLHIVIGEVHHSRNAVRAAFGGWLTIPDRGLFTGIAIFGAIGTGKTSCCMRPFARQILSWRASDQERRIGGLVLEVKGNFCHQVRALLTDAARGEDYIELGVDGKYCYNPLYNDLDSFALAYSIATLLNNLYGRGKEPFWQQAYTNLVKFIILLFRVVDGYVTLFNIYECAIDPDKLSAKIREGKALFANQGWVVIEQAVYLAHDRLERFKWETTKDGRLRAARSAEVEAALAGVAHEVIRPTYDADRKEQFDAVRRWFDSDWMSIDLKLRTSIVEGISVFLSLFDDNPRLKRIFCPPKECYDKERNTDGRYGIPLPSLRDLIEAGKVVALNMPVGKDAATARAIGCMLKLDFQRAMLGRIPDMKVHPERYFREALFLCDEYHALATVGESDPSGDEKFFSLSREAKCIPIVATQSISSLRSALPGESWRTLLQTFRTKIFLTLTCDFSAKIASELCGMEDKLVPSYNVAESGQDVQVSALTGKALAHKTGMTISKTYALHRRAIFEPRRFLMLKNAQAIVLPYDGGSPLDPTLALLKPYYLDENVSYFDHLEAGRL